MRDLLWNPNDRDEFLAIIEDYESDQNQYAISDYDPVKISVRGLIEGFRSSRPRWENEDEVQYRGLSINPFEAEARFKSDLTTESFMDFLIWLFNRNDKKMQTKTQ